MTLTVSRPALLAALKALSGAISRRTAHPAVGQVEIDVEGKPDPMTPPSLCLSMTDFHVTAYYWPLLFGYEGNDWTAIVDAARLQSFLAHDPADEVSLSLAGGRGDLVVAGRSTAKFATLSADSYAVHPVPPTEGWEALPADALFSALSAVSWAVGTGRHGSPSTLCLKSPGEALVDVYAMRDGRVSAGVQGFCASVLDIEGRSAAGVSISPSVAAFLAARKLDPGTSVEVAVELGRRVWWRGPGFQVAEQWAADQVHSDYGKIFDQIGRQALLVATLTEDQAEELISGLHTLSGLGSWGLGSEGKRTDVLKVGFGETGIALKVRSDAVHGEFAIEHLGAQLPAEVLWWYTSFPGELIKALGMLLGGGEIEARCHEGMHLFLFNERGGCALLSGRMP